MKSNRLAKQAGEDIENLRAKKTMDEAERHNRMCEKMQLEASMISNRKNYLADQTFQNGQSVLSGIVNKTRNVDDRRTQTIQNLKDRQAQAFDRVMSKMEDSLVAEEERKLNAMSKTADQHMTFLSRLENQNKERNKNHKYKFDSIA